MKTIGKVDHQKEWIDYSSLSLLKLCPRKYFWRVEQMLTSSTPSVSLLTGKAIHASLAAYYKAKIAGKLHPEAFNQAILALAEDMRAVTVPDDNHNTPHCTKVMEQYFSRYIDEPYTYKDAEVGFAVDLGEFVFVGMIDAVVDSPFGLLTKESKSTTVVGKRWELRTKPNNQIDGYVSAYSILTGEKVSGGLLDVIPLTAPKNTGKINEPFRFVTVRTEKDIDEWLENVKEWFITLNMHRERKVWPQNTEACAPLVGFTCEYISMCSQYPSVTYIHMMNVPNEFKVEEWKPWDIPQEVKDENRNSTLLL
jgi:hypothetical protein